MIRWVEKHKGTPGTRSDYRQIDGWWLGTLCRINDLAPGGRWHWTVFTDDERGPNGTADDEQGAKDACKAALVRLLAEDEGLPAGPEVEK